MSHVITLKESTSGTRTITTKSTAIIGLIGTSMAGDNETQADIDAAFPLDTPVLFTSAAIAAGKAGSVGTLKATLTAIDDIVTPIIIVVRVAVGETDAEMDANVIGATDGSRYTGLQALLIAKGEVGYQPRIIGAPGLDSAAVTAKLAIAARKLRGFAYAKAIGDTVTQVTAYRATFSSRELMLIWPNSSTSFAGDAIARAMALRAYIDGITGWHKTISNVSVAGITALTASVHYDLLDKATDAGVLNDGDVTTIIRTSSGFRFWGNHTCAGADQPDYIFESATRTLYALQDVIAAVFEPFFDAPMNVAMIKDLLQSVNRTYATYTGKGWIMGAQAFFDGDSNSSGELAAGRPVFRIQFTPCAPMENPQVDMVITDTYYTGFAESVAAA